MFRELLRRSIWAVLPFIVLILVWIVANQGQFVKEIFLPSIPSVGKSLFNLFSNEHYLDDVWVSIFRVMAAFVLSTILAIPLGLWAGFSNKFASLLEPFVGFIRYLPVPAFVPLCILWFGLGDLGKIAIIFMGTFFQLILMVADSARNVPKEYFEAAQTLGASKGSLFLKVLWRASMPDIINASRTAVGWAWTYLVVAEIAGATTGIGFRIMEAQRYVQAANIFAGIVVIGILGVTTDLIFKGLYKFMFPWIESA
jgi:NitT/TauT family transport system permease protein